MSNSGKVALITGAAIRIGANIADALHQDGYAVVLHYNTSAKAADALAKTLNQRRPNSCITAQANLLVLADIERLAKTTTDKWGGVDLLINNASTYSPTPLALNDADSHSNTGVNNQLPETHNKNIC